MAGGFPTADMNTFLDGQITGTLYIALWTVAPSIDGVGGTEVSEASYSRIAHSAWNAAAAKSKTNNGEIDFGDPLTDWGTIVAATAMTLLTGGVQKGLSDTLNKPVVTADDKVYIPDGGLVFSMGQ